MRKLTNLQKLKLAIKALDNFGVYPEIITDMLKDLQSIEDDLKSESIAKEHFRKQRDEGLLELSELYTAEFTKKFAEWCSINNFEYKTEYNLWITDKLGGKTTAQLLTEFKVWKEEQK